MKVFQYMKCGRNQVIQPLNKQVSKEVVHKLEFGDTAVMQYKQFAV